MKLFIADDEVEVVEGILTLIDWKGNGIELVGYAMDGEEALYKIKSLKPDIVLIDIRMPKLDGLEVIEKAQGEGIRFKSIILSGYDDFYFAKKAIELKSFSYLLKPCRPEEILKEVLKAREDIEKEIEKENTLKEFINYYNDTLPVIRERVLSEVLYRVRSSSEVAEDFVKYKIDFPYKKYCVVLMKIEIEAQNEIEEAYKLACADVIRKKAGDMKIEVIRDREEIAILINSEEEFKKESIEGFLNDVKSEIYDKLEVRAYFGIGKWVEGADKIKYSYYQAKEALELKFFAEEFDAIFYEDIWPHQDNLYYPVNEEREIINSVILNKREDLNKKVENFLNALYTGGFNQWFVKASILVLLGNLIKACYEKNVDIGDIAGEKAFEGILKADRKETLKSLSLSVIYKIAEKIERAGDKNPIIKDAVEYIDKNYDKDISLESVAKEVYVTPAYLSILFKKEMNINFVSYLHKVRVEKAKKLLEDRSLKTYQVANMVGFGDEKYFSQVFKKYTGLTPSQYRDSL
ncbi:two-component system response regulator YesN [Caldanaerobacter subterraneus subsp. tengcongensis MB4]|uniref:Stage 0 sporulation protein A homolog n=1 Tax=Caldanaerobacter subterraneus subsp. tengcongensis (strain DSM 15242 / JCM 11007 / NBRC 100824 / MB4) TaxID=273068 RepID=Q8R7Q5_CALS4|nr:helix-turn-helix domain-containing protein [Caldanaerobacter subterraneus]AAM25484.1 AraC-type DNA-binding domain-containing proteins [Caldanaerobacter subterraneus subsp. tengcongensis MB4]MCS3914911.1 two-component system response regulator YesN [Caldanaerobacter subterraneus subsp. tengcongensis MB4]